MPNEQVFRFQVNDRQLESSERALSGGQIMAMAHVDPSCELFHRGEGDEDWLVRSDDRVELDWRQPSRFYTMSRVPHQGERSQ